MLRNKREHRRNPPRSEPPLSAATEAPVARPNEPDFSTVIYVRSPAGIIEPVIPGTKIPIYKVSALLDGGATIAEIIEDYPSLKHEQIEWAREYARAIPYTGRPYAKTSLKRALRTLNLAEFLPE